MILFFTLFLAVSSFGATINKEVTRVIDATTHIVKITTEIKVSGANKNYQLIFPNNQINHLAYIHVSSKGKDLKLDSPTS